MEIKKFVQKVKTARSSAMRTGSLNLKAYSNKVFWILKADKLKYYKDKKDYKLYIWFKEPIVLTIFEAELLFFLYVLNRVPYDYANYHKCEAGQRFIKNIKKIIVKKSE